MIRLVMNKRQEAILAVLILVAAVGIFLLYTTGLGRASDPSQEAAEAQPEGPQLFDVATEQKQKHDEFDASLLTRLQRGGYTLDNPLVIVNPYETSPLTAMVVFTTDEPAEITVQIAGKTPDVSVTHTFGSFGTEHIIPVYGLYPDSVNFVEIIAAPEDSQDSQSPPESLKTELLIETGAMPEDFPDGFIPSQPDPAPPQPPFYFTFVKKSAYDTNGDCRWYYNGFETEYPSEYTADGNMLIIAGSIEDGGALLLEVNMLGRIVSLVPYESANKMDGFDAHHFERRALYN